MAGPTRRRFLATAAIGATALAGCSGSGGDGNSPATDATDTTATDPGTETATTGGTATGGGTTSGDLDLREANVTAVDVEDRGGEYRFSVTLYHDDDGEAGYANWWQVETTAGDRLGRRELLHAHGTREFTRSATVAVPEDVTCVVVRGHDQAHAYGGQAMTVDLASGATRAVRQGSEREPIEEC